MHSTFERPFKPVELTSGVIEAFDLQALAGQLREEESFTEHGRNDLTLTRDDHHTMALTVAKAGKVAHEHSPLGPTTIVVLTGSMKLMTNADTQQTSLTSGMAAAFAPGVTHRIESQTDSAFLMIIGGRQ
jgi:quercetin dioxygenase-like cupin family protein